MRGTDALSSGLGVPQHWPLLRTGILACPALAALHARATAAVLRLSFLFSVYLHHELPRCSSWGTSALIGSDEPVSMRHCGGERCHIWGRWLPVIARLLLGTPSGLHCCPRDEKRLRWDTGHGAGGVGAAPSAECTGCQEPGQCSRHWPLGIACGGGADLPACLLSQGHAQMHQLCTPIVAPSPSLASVRGSQAPSPHCPPAKGLSAVAHPFC